VRVREATNDNKTCRMRFHAE